MQGDLMDLRRTEALAEKSYPLDGVRVIALEQYIAGPFCSMWLADAGADVIKVERPGCGDPRRNYLPIITGINGESIYGGFVSYNRNKRSIVIDLQSEEGKGVYRDLCSTADVVVENLRPGTVEKLGVGYEELRSSNERLIYAAISGFGRMPGLEGPYSDWPAFDPVIQAMAGITWLLGDEDGPPQLGFLGLADLVAGITTGYQILLALFMRDKTGKGQFIDSSMYESLVSLNERSIMFKTFSGETLTRGKDKYQAPADTYEAKDGWLSLIAPNDTIWARLCQAVGRDDWITNDSLASGRKRALNRVLWEPDLREWVRVRKCDEVVSRLLQFGVPVGRVQTSEDLVNCPHLAARRAFVDVQDPVGGTLRMARAPFQMSGVKEVRDRTAPRLGEHSSEILVELGYDTEVIEHLTGIWI